MESDSIMSEPSWNPSEQRDGVKKLLNTVDTEKTLDWKIDLFKGQVKAFKYIFLK